MRKSAQKIAPFYAKLAAVLVLYALAVAYPVYHAAQLGCFRYYDLGIYTQGIAHLSVHNLNPWLTGRQLHLFFDHTDLVLWTATWWRAVMPPMQAGLVTESLWITSSVWPLIRRVRGQMMAQDRAVLVALALVLNPATLAAAQFPLHPTTWAMAPMFACVTRLREGRIKAASAPLMCLVLCKEEFAFCAVAWGLVAYVGASAGRSKGAAHSALQRRYGLMWGAGGLVWLLGVYGVRPLFGATAAYPAQLWTGLTTRGFDFWLVRMLNPTMWQRLAFCAVGMGPLIWVLRPYLGPKAPASTATSTSTHAALDMLRPWEAWAICAGLAPCIGIRFLGMAWGYQYDACIAAACLAFVAVPSGDARPLTRTHKMMVVAGLAAAWGSMGTCADAGAPGVRFGHYGHAQARCDDTPERRASLARMRRDVVARKDAPVLMGQNLAPLVADAAQVYVIGGPQPVVPMIYSAVWLEVPPAGDVWPLGAQTLQAAIAAWRRDPNVDVMIDDGAFFGAQGRLAYPVNATFR